MQNELQTLRTQMMEARRRFLNGDESARVQMHELAEATAAAYNDKAREIAKKHGMKPRLINAAKIIRQGENFR